MISYAPLQGMVRSLSKSLSPGEFERQVVPALVDLWLDDYAGRWGKGDIVSTRDGLIRAEFLFDIAAERLIGAWALSRGKSHELRDASRMRGAPLGGGKLYHRGHAIPHSMGGGLDINLVPQLGRINIGDFRRLEIRAVDLPGSIYFSHWIYESAKSQKPSFVYQGLLAAGSAADVTRHVN